VEVCRHPNHHGVESFVVVLLGAGHMASV
jgi:hypothetical protein